MFGGQNQKSGINSVNQQANNGGIAQNAARDIINNFGNNTDDKDLGIIKDIFDYALEKAKDYEAICPDENDGKVLNLKRKVGLNFDDNQLEEIKGLIHRSWQKMEIIEEFIQGFTTSNANSIRIDSLTIMMQDLYKDEKKCSASNERIADVNIINSIARKIIPNEKTTNSDYFGNAVAIVLYFFQMCEIGIKTETESQNYVTILD